MFGKRMAAIGMSAILAAALCPAMAVAEPLEAGNIQPQATQAQSAQPQAAKAKTVYVITKVAKKYPNAAQNSVMGLTTTYKYNANKLVLQRTSKQGTTNPITETLKWTYDKNNLVKKVASPSRSMTFTSKNGKWKTGTYKMKSSGGKTTENYTYKSGNISKCTRISDYTSLGAKQKQVDNYYFTYNKDRLTKRALASVTINAYSYDKKGNLKKEVSRTHQTNYANSYNKVGLLKKRSELLPSNGVATTTTFTYKKVQVKSALAKKVAAQQWAIINDNNNFALFGAILH